MLVNDVKIERIMDIHANASSTAFVSRTENEFVIRNLIFIYFFINDLVRLKPSLRKHDNLRFIVKGLKVGNKILAVFIERTNVEM